MSDDLQAPGRTGTGTLVEDRFWEPHASPWSVWPLVAAYPTLILAVYRRDRALLAGTLLAVVLNLLLVSPPETDEAWATRVVLGERVWLERGLHSSPPDLGLVAVGAAVHLYAVRAAVARRPVRTLVGTAASMALMLLFFGRMVRLYETREDAGSDGNGPG
jgi:drug/metabolite transporter (DMT)-like permease